MTGRAPAWFVPLALAGLLAAASGCGPKTLYDAEVGLLTRTDEAFVLPIGMRERTRWQLEIPGVAGAPVRYGFAYDAILYRIRLGGPMVRPESVVVLQAHDFPEDVKEAPSIVERNERLAKAIRGWLSAKGMGRLASQKERFVFDGQMLAVTEKDATEALEKPTMGAAFLFGADYVLEALYEVYPPAEDETMSAKEHQEALRAVVEILGRAQVK